MDKVFELIKQNKYSELWQICCGFIDLSLNDFMKIQEHLLLEQLVLLRQCELGKKIMKGNLPLSASEFRHAVPLTTYVDYAQYFQNRDGSVLPEKPAFWHYTSGRSSAKYQKWIPITDRQYEELGTAYLAAILFSSCDCKGSIVLQRKDKLLYAFPSLTSFSGTLGKRISDMGIFDVFPPLPETADMSLLERVRSGLDQAVYHDMDFFSCNSDTLIDIGERFAENNNFIHIKPLLNKPKLLFRLSKGYIVSKIAGRHMLPKDIWKLKGLVADGTETQICKDKIKRMWGRYPLDIYTTAESVIIAMQTWNYQDMTFLPYFNFMEFVKESDLSRMKKSDGYRPPTYLLNEVKPGENYGLIITNLLGGALVRYQTGDTIKITSRGNEKLHIDIPQMSFYSRMDES